MSETSEPTFEEPWQARAFAIAVALHNQGVYTWSEWTARLGARIAADESPADHDAGGYYRDWLDALEELLVEKGIASAGDTDRWSAAWRQAATRTPHGAPIEVRPSDF